MAKIYTRQGDHGETRLARAPAHKSDPSIALLGNLDELNCFLGLAACELQTADWRQRLQRVQRQLFLIGAVVAGDAASEVAWEHRAAAVVAELESEIDSWETSLPPLQNFILPGGACGGAHLHLGRALVRRAERGFFAWRAQPLDPPWNSLGIYLNRLSDWLFVAARAANHASGNSETVWLMDR